MLPNVIFAAVYHLLRLAVRAVYLIRTLGAENLPGRGPALLVANHVSWADAFLLTAAQPRPIRFLMGREFYEMRWAKPFLRWLGAIPISPDDPPKRIVAALQEARRALEEGSLVCIFAEGHVTRTGLMGPFRAGFERIVRGLAAPIVPVYLGGVWGSVFSYAEGRILSRLPGLRRRSISVLFGRPMAPSSEAGAVRDAVLELSCEYFEDRKRVREPLGAVFVRQARRSWGRPAVSDTTGAALSYGRTLAASVALGKRLEKELPGEDRVGILLPPSVGGALANLALTLRRKVPVNLSYSAPAEAIRSAVEQAGLRTVITSRRFLERFPTLPLPERVLFLEDVLAGLSRAAKLRALFAARSAPRRLISGGSPFRPDDVAALLFSSGSTGEPKGVMLSHHNLLSSIEALQPLYRFTPEDRICGALPFFHSFGFSCTLWLPLLSGFSAVYHANPLEAGKVAEAVRESGATILPATPSFLLAYLRRAKKEDFRSLRLVFTGAERLDPRLADAFHEKFDLRPLEGYGATELAPVATVSVPAVELDRVADPGWKPGSVGRPLPGVALKVVDPDTGEPFPTGTQGLLLAKGPNVMLGYWGKSAKTAEVLRDGWYSTGDMATIDEDGFVTITGRLARFSKIGGEMVPHGAVEEVLKAALPDATTAVAVTSVPDKKRGERLVVLYTSDAGDPENLRRTVDESALPNLWKPARDAYIPVHALPLLGSGKIDLRKLRDLALERQERLAA
ncbi:MAG: AMP-binding protein [Deltaproteobacteria bacterium]|nr:AMP-binding protein [Deltaproteobacteria bacterium]